MNNLNHKGNITGYETDLDAIDGILNSRTDNLLVVFFETKTENLIQYKIMKPKFNKKLVTIHGFLDPVKNWNNLDSAALQVAIDRSIIHIASNNNQSSYIADIEWLDEKIEIDENERFLQVFYIVLLYTLSFLPIMSLTIKTVVMEKRLKVLAVLQRFVYLIQNGSL